MRASLRQGRDVAALRILLRFIADDEIVTERCVELAGLTRGDATCDFAGWFLSPDEIGHVQVVLPSETAELDLAELTLHPVAERDPKCHPLANVPRWSTYQPPFALRELLLPEELGDLAEYVHGARVRVVEQPRSKKALRELAQGRALVLGANWAEKLGLKARDLQQLAADSWVILDLAAFGRALERDGVAPIRGRRFKTEHEIMAARVEYADVATRGFAMQDVIPYGWRGSDGFSARVLIANRAWKSYADSEGFATLLSSETPYENSCGDVLMAACSTAGGELLVTDVPWLAAEGEEHLLAPRLTRHLWRMLVGEPLEDQVIYWNRWEEADVLVRDLADAPRRYPEMQAVRWASPNPEIAHLGLSLAATDQPVSRHILISSGRMDHAGAHDGVPAEAMFQFCKWLAREMREQTAWVRQNLAQTRVTWQFDTVLGLRHALDYPSGSGIVDQPPPTGALRVRDGRWTRATEAADAAVPFDREVTLTVMPGVYGDGSLDYQRVLTQRLMEEIEAENVA
jgi:hypothetical protein